PMQAPRRFLPKVWRSSIGSKWRLDKPGAAMGLARLAHQQREMVEARRMLEDAQRVGAEKLAMLTDTDRPRPLTALGGEMPVGSIDLPRLRSDFRETAAWLPQLRTGADGTATATFRLPDSLTRYRLTALALTRETDIGTGRSRIEAALPLAVQVLL